MLINLGSLCILSSFGALKGYYNYLIGELLCGEKRWFSVGYLLSIIGSLYASIIIKNYLITIATLICEIIFLLYFVCSSFPGGQRALSFILQMIVSTFRKAVRI